TKCSHDRQPTDARIEYTDRLTLGHRRGILPHDASGVRHAVTIWPLNLPAGRACREGNASATATLPRCLAGIATTDSGLESQQKIEEGRGFLLERLVEASDAGRGFLGGRQVTLGDTTLHCAARFSTVRTNQTW